MRYDTDSALRELVAHRASQLPAHNRGERAAPPAEATEGTASRGGIEPPIVHSLDALPFNAEFGKTRGDTRAAYRRTGHV
jgi:hypothetical protein